MNDICKKGNRSALFHCVFWAVYLSVEMLIRPFVAWVYAGGGMGSGTFFCGNAHVPAVRFFKHGMANCVGHLLCGRI